jgi:hypothetical protein
MVGDYSYIYSQSLGFSYILEVITRLNKLINHYYLEDGTGLNCELTLIIITITMI